MRLYIPFLVKSSGSEIPEPLSKNPCINLRTHLPTHLCIRDHRIIPEKEKYKVGNYFWGHENQ